MENGYHIFYRSLTMLYGMLVGRSPEIFLLYQVRTTRYEAIRLSLLPSLFTLHAEDLLLGILFGPSPVFSRAH